MIVVDGDVLGLYTELQTDPLMFLELEIAELIKEFMEPISEGKVENLADYISGFMSVTTPMEGDP